MTDQNSTVSSPTHPIGTLTHTVRRSEIIEHLTNFRIEIDRAIHALPGILLGVSCAGVIQASIHLNWHIEHLRGSLIEAMLREGYNPLGISERDRRPSQSLSESTTTHSNPSRGPDLSRPQRREQVYTQPQLDVNEFMLAAANNGITNPVPQSSNPNSPANQNRTSSSHPADQVVPESTSRGLTNGLPSSHFRSTYVTAFRNRQSHSQPSGPFNHLFDPVGTLTPVNVDSILSDYRHGTLNQERTNTDELSDLFPTT